MIRRIEARNFRSLVYIDQKLDSFHVLVGPNASGKTTFMDVIGFIADIVRLGIDGAISNRTSNYTDLTFSSRGGNIELAIEVELPSKVTKLYNHGAFSIIRYEIGIGLNESTKEHSIKEERAILLPNTNIEKNNQDYKRTLFPEYLKKDTPIINKSYQQQTYKLVLRKKSGGNDNFYPESNKETGKGGFMPSFKLGEKRSALGNLPADDSKFPAAMWLRDFLLDGVQSFILDSQKIKYASPPGQSKKFKPDGSNLPWVINDLAKDEQQFNKWIKHIKTALPDIQNIETIEREDDKHRYLKIIYQNNIKIPSWLVSDGTLRLLALTLPAYLPNFTGVYLIEEPENGIHPKAVETIYQSLSSVYNAQIMLASHSPIVLSLVRKNQVLCFAKTIEGITDIVNGDEHPALMDWKGETNLSVLYASGVLG